MSISTALSKSRWRNSTTKSASRRRTKGDNRRIVKELEKAKKRLGVRLKKRADRESKDRALTFEELGVDQIFVDEADLYKNLAYVTKMNRIAGLPNSDSNRAFDMFLKIRYLQERSGGRGRRFRHRHANLKHSGRDVHDASLSWRRRCWPNATSSISIRGRQTLPRR